MYCYHASLMSRTSVICVRPCLAGKRIKYDPTLALAPLLGMGIARPQYLAWYLRPDVRWAPDHA